MRKKNSIVNIIASLGSYLIATIFTFITQSFIVRFLGIEYSGLNGLFTNVITMLSIAELGVGTIIIFKLYKPLAQGNIENIKSWMIFYRNCYRKVALFITIVGLLLTPIIPNIVNSTDIQESIVLLYLLSLLDTIFSYIMTYKRSLLYADQKNYIINFVHTLYIILMNITQILFLMLFKNYTLFLIIKILFRLMENMIINLYVNKNYTYIKEQAKELSIEEKKDVFSRIKFIFFQQISFVINKGIDNIIMSYFLGVVTVGLYVNYNTIVAAITQILYQIISSLTASVGNLLTENDAQKSYDVYKKINMLNSLLTGMAIVGFTCVIQPFICLWVGDQYLLSNKLVGLFALYIYVDSIRRSITIFKEAAGICKEDRWTYIIMALINLILSLLLCKKLGMAGVILGTCISYLFLILYSYPKYIFTPLFKKGFKEYYIENLKYIIFICISLGLSCLVIQFIAFNNYFLQFLVKGILSVGITTIIFIMAFWNTEEFKYYKQIVFNMLEKK